MRLSALAAAAALTSAAAPLLAQPPPEPVILQAEIGAAPESVWQALATPQGVTTFFAAEAMVDPQVGGPYELYFLSGNPPGLRGGEGVRVLALEEPSRLLITWNAPPKFGPLRNQQTVVEFLLEPIRNKKTLLTLTHSGWGRGIGWQEVRDYFEKAWPVVLGRLQYRFDNGPVDWAEAPDGAAYFTPAANPPEAPRSD